MSSVSLFFIHPLPLYLSDVTGPFLSSMYPYMLPSPPTAASNVLPANPRRFSVLLSLSLAVQTSYRMTADSALPSQRPQAPRLRGRDCQHFLHWREPAPSRAHARLQPVIFAPRLQPAANRPRCRVDVFLCRDVPPPLRRNIFARLYAEECIVLL